MGSVGASREGVGIGRRESGKGAGGERDKGTKDSLSPLPAAKISASPPVSTVPWVEADGSREGGGGLGSPTLNQMSPLPSPDSKANARVESRYLRGGGGGGGGVVRDSVNLSDREAVLGRVATLEEALAVNDDRYRRLEGLVLMCCCASRCVAVCCGVLRCVVVCCSVL